MDGGRSFKHDTVAYPNYMADTSERWHDWAGITCPTLVLRGRLSRDLPHDEAVRLTESIARSRLAEIEETGHWLHHQQPVAFEDALRWFLDSPPE